MTEKQFYKKFVRPAFHRPPSSVIWRVEDYGLPDTLIRSGDDTYGLELKTLAHLPVRAGTPFRIGTTVEQRRTLSQWNGTSTSRVTGLILVSVAREGIALLMDPKTPPEIDLGELEHYTYARVPLDPELIRQAVLIN